jgi:tetratricopeptide (TPR) repeat protein
VLTLRFGEISPRFATSLRGSRNYLLQNQHGGSSLRKLVIALLGVFVASALQAATRDADSIRKWREDIAYFHREMPRRHASLFHSLPQKDFDAMVQSLDERVPSLRDDEIIVGLAHIVASLGPRDGHTHMNLRNRALGFHMLPVSFYVYPDGLFVRAAAKEYAGIAGSRVVSIGGTPASQALQSIETIAAFDNEMSRKSYAGELLSESEALRGLHITSGEGTDPVVLEVESADGARRKVSVNPVSSIDSIEWVDVRDAKPLMFRRWGPTNPLTLSTTRKNFWLDYDEASQLLYVNFSAVADMKDETLAAFFKRVFEFADAHPVKKFVLDVRNNGGGNNYLNRPILYDLIQRRETIGRSGTLFAIIGRQTFSAAMNFANMLDMYTSAIFVGEPTGGAPNHFGDSLTMTLPNSKVPVQVSSVWWQDQDPRDQRLWIAPDIAAEATANDDRSGRDPALEAIRNYKPEPSLSQRVRDALAAGGRAKAEEAIRAWRAEPAHKFLTGASELNSLGAALFGENRADDAVTVFELNAAVNPDSWLAHNSLGRAYASKGNAEAARAEYMRALEIRPNAPETLSALDRLK